MAFYYRAFDLIIDSSVEIPELVASTHTNRDPDVRIIRGRVGHIPDEDRHQTGRAYHLESGEMVYVRDGCGRFLVRDGAVIEVDPDTEADDRVWRLSLYGPALGLLLIQRGYLVLHGGAVVGPEGAILMLGASGSGKSTLTAELCRQGGRLLTDDLVAIDMNAPMPLVLPGVPLIKLWPDAIKGAPDGAWTKVLHPDYVKLGRRLDESALATATPVDRVFLLQGGERLAREPLTGTVAFGALMMSLFAARYGKVFVAGLDGRGLLRQLTRLMEVAPVEVLRRPQDRDLLPETAKFVMAAIRQ